MLEAPSLSQNELCSAGKSDTSAGLVVSTECLCASSEYTVPVYNITASMPTDVSCRNNLQI